MALLGRVVCESVWMARNLTDDKVGERSRALREGDLQSWREDDVATLRGGFETLRREVRLFLATRRAPSISLFKQGALISISSKKPKDFRTQEDETLL